MSTHHEIVVRGTASKAYTALQQLDLGRSPLVRFLFRLRGLPRQADSLAGLQALGFNTLYEEPGRALVLGIAGQFWFPRGRLQQLSAAEFERFARPGWAKAVWTMELFPMGEDRARLVTETHVQCFGEEARRRFRRYWRVVGPFSGLIRREMLRLIRDTVERRPPTTEEPGSAGGGRP